MSISLGVALACYAILAASAAFTLYGTARLVVWIFLAGLAVKTWIAHRQRMEEQREEEEGQRDRERELEEV
jgi:membrane protein implicated in regulation of membrane protease activity